MEGGEKKEFKVLEIMKKRLNEKERTDKRDRKKMKTK